MTQFADNRKPVLLIVDDEPIMRIIITETLDEQGYELIVVGSGEAAWDKLRAEPGLIDAVLLDRMMPGIDGMEVLRRIKQHEQLKCLPVILQTADSSPEQIEEGLLEGAFHYLTKPFSPEQLRTVVANALRDYSKRF